MISPLVCSSHFICTLKSPSIPPDIDAFTSSLLPGILSRSGQMFTSRQASAEPGNPSEGMTSLGLPRRSHCLFRCLQSGGVKPIAVGPGMGVGVKGSLHPGDPSISIDTIKRQRAEGSPLQVRGHPGLMNMEEAWAQGTIWPAVSGTK